MVCPIHRCSFKIRAGVSSKTNKPFIRWNCPVKEGDKFCDQGEFGRGQNVSEEIANLLRELIDTVAIKRVEPKKEPPLTPEQEDTINLDEVPF